mmetsp:Transcript_8451/g.21088  ORF Transcript_8451/g.21088 Transcript_8451/m.21088 type:complete len:100 (+) Transcript_8451:2567-2866(+)
MTVLPTPTPTTTTTTSLKSASSPTKFFPSSSKMMISFAMNVLTAASSPNSRRRWITGNLGVIVMLDRRKLLDLSCGQREYAKDELKQRRNKRSNEDDIR